MANNISEQIQELVDNNDVILFMKGTLTFPQCGFSSVVANILGNLEVPVKDINVLEDMEIREGIKAFSNWPTIPQLYIKGEFIGGCDIVKEMFESGELQEILQEQKIIAA